MSKKSKKVEKTVEEVKDTLEAVEEVKDTLEAVEEVKRSHRKRAIRSER